MTFTFTVSKRAEGEAEALRLKNMVPGVLYGPGTKPISIVADYNSFAKLYNTAGESSLIDLTIDGEKNTIKTLVQDIQYDPVKRTMIHFDLRRIDMNKEMEVVVELHFINEAPAVKELGGTLVKTVEGLKVRCLPKDLISEINIDMSVLKTFDDIIRLKDLVVPAGLKFMENPEMAIAKVQAPLTEEQIKAMEEEGKKGVEVIEQVEKKVKEEEVAEEGAEGAKPDAKKEEKKKE